MHKTTIRVLIASLIINLIFIVAITGTTINIKNKNEQIKTLTSTNESLNLKVSKNDANSETKTLLNTQKIKDTISNFINAEFKVN